VWVGSQWCVDTVLMLFGKSHTLSQPIPGPYINDIKDSTVFYGNRVIKEYKEK